MAFDRAIVEYERISREDLGDQKLRRLQAFDEAHADRTGQTIFDWHYRNDIRARNYVGVVQVPGVTIEILPKIDATSGGIGEAHAKTLQRAQKNLLYMLSYTGELPIRQRDLAELDTLRLPLLEALILVFAESLLAELGRGIPQAYVPREETSQYVRGRIMLREQIRRFAVHKEKIAVAYDDFIADTLLNQILKAGCERLLHASKSSRAQRALRIGLLHFADVSRRIVQPHDFARIHLDRNTERFQPHVDFCRIVLGGDTPTPSRGQASSFSLLFPMEQLFEQFIGEFVRRNARSFGWQPGDVHCQARRRGKWLLRSEGGIGRFRLRPDIVVDGPAGSTQTIIDTKWKRLKADVDDPRNGVSQADLYQLYAYANQYGCSDSMLLYPHVPGASAKSYVIDGKESVRVRVGFVNISRDLSADPGAFRDELQAVLLPSAQSLSLAH